MARILPRQGEECVSFGACGAGGFVSIPADREYKYEELLDRMYSLLVANNPELAGDRKRFLIKPPQVVRVHQTPRPTEPEPSPSAGAAVASVLLLQHR